MILLAFDAATPGRLAMIENVTLDTARYLKNIEKWHNDCNWIHEKWKDGKRIQFWGMVGVRDIADIFFTIEQAKVKTLSQFFLSLYVNGFDAFTTARFT